MTARNWTFKLLLFLFLLPQVARTQSWELKYVDLYEKIQHSVVNVYAFTETSDELSQRTLNERDAIVLKGHYSAGTAFFSNDEVHLITNAHVIENAKSIFIQHGGKSLYRTELIGKEPDFDIAVLKIVAGGFGKPLVFGNSKKTRIGEWVGIFGNPLGIGTSFAHGVISAKGRVFNSGKFDNFIQISAGINPGNSGGPLVNLSGEVIGVVSRKMVGRGVEGIGLAIPSSFVQPIAEQIISQGYYQRPWFGFVIRDLPLKESKSISQDCMIQIEDTNENSPARRANLGPNYLICSVNNIKVYNSDELALQLFEAGLNASIKIEVFDKISKRKKFVSLVAQAEDEDWYRAKKFLESKHLGLGLEEIDSVKRSLYPMIITTKGILVREVKQGLLGEKSGLKAGDLIISIDKNPVSNLKEGMLFLSKSLSKSKIVRIQVLRKLLEEIQEISLNIS